MPGRKYLDEALDRFGPHADVVFAQHHWPVWGSARIAEYVGAQRDLYKYLHDQTAAPDEPRLHAGGDRRAARRCRGASQRRGTSAATTARSATTSSAVYQRYLGWYDANPANLNPLPPVERGAEVRRVHGRGRRGDRARARGLRAGEYRWVAEALSHVVFADPANAEARQLGADALEQLGYQPSRPLAQRLPARRARAAAGRGPTPRRAPRSAPTSSGP